MSEAKKVLFFDLAARIGFCAGRAGENTMPEWGVIQIPDGTYGVRFNAAHNAFCDLIDKHKPDVVGVEDAISQGGNRAWAARLTLGLHAILDLVCVQSEVDLQRVSVDRIRTAVIGRCRVTALERQAKLKVKEAVVLPWIMRQGWGEITSHDSRDAAVGFAYLCGVRATRRGA